MHLSKAISMLHCHFFSFPISITDISKNYNGNSIIYLVQIRTRHARNDISGKHQKSGPLKRNLDRDIFGILICVDSLKQPRVVVTPIPTSMIIFSRTPF